MRSECYDRCRLGEVIDIYIDIYLLDSCVHIYHISLILVCMLRRLSHFRLFATPWTVAHQALLSTEFSRQEY